MQQISSQNIADRLKRLRVALGMTQKEFAKKIAVSRAYLSRIEAGAKSGGNFLMKVEMIEREERLKKLRLNATSSLMETPPQYGSNVHANLVRLRLIPVFSMVQAGQATDFDELPYEWQTQVEYDGPEKHVFGLHVVGHSMEPRFLEGDIVIVDPKKPASNGSVVVANIKNEGVLLKLMHHSGDHKNVTLTSYNPVFPPLQHHRENFHWIYPVRRCVRNFY